MKKHLWIVMICVLAGCLPNSELATASATPTHTLSPAASETVTLTVATSQATLSFPTLTPHPTLNPDEALTLQHYLENNPPCQLPCWGGVTPGITAVSEAEKEFMKLSSISTPEFTYFGKSGDTWYIGRLHIYYPLVNTVVNIGPGFLASSENMIVIHIRIYTQSLPYQNSTGEYFGDKEYNALLSAYSMPEILSTYGLPNVIYTRADINAGEPTAPDFFIIRLLYLDLGIFISYTIPMEEEGTAFRFCPSESQIMLDLTPQDVGENYVDYFQQVGATEWTSLQKTHHKLLDDALGMTNKEFSQAIISSPETCFETPIDIWPDP